MLRIISDGSSSKRCVPSRLGLDGDAESATASAVLVLVIFGRSKTDRSAASIWFCTSVSEFTLFGRLDPVGNVRSDVSLVVEEAFAESIGWTGPPSSVLSGDRLGSIFSG